MPADDRLQRQNSLEDINDFAEPSAEAQYNKKQPTRKGGAGPSFCAGGGVPALKFGEFGQS